jgi:hypothetical protein
MPARGEREPCERINGGDVGGDVGQLTGEQARTRACEHGTDTLVEARDILARDRAVDREPNRCFWPHGSSRLDGWARRNSSASHALRSRCGGVY